MDSLVDLMEVHAMKKKSLLLGIPCFIALLAASLLTSRLGWKGVPFEEEKFGTVWVPHNWEYHADSHEFTNSDGEVVMSVYYDNTEPKAEELETEEYYKTYSSANAAGFKRGWFEVEGECRMLSILFFSPQVDAVNETGTVTCYIWDPDVDLATVRKITASRW